MATNEAGFKVEFKKSLRSHYGDRAQIWTNNDMYRVGLPDFSASFEADMFGCEVKFVAKIPKRATSKVLGHEVSDSQKLFIQRLRDTGNKGCILIGLPDVAVVMLDLKNNYTLDELKRGYRIEKVAGAWKVAGFFEYIRGDDLGKK